MKKYLLILFIASIFFSCNDDEKIIFDADLSDLVVSFEPFEGGAIMNYTLPSNTEIYGIMAKYKDYNGKEITVKGTHSNNSVELFGFNAAEDAVPVEVFLIDVEDNLTKPVIKSFSTLQSAALTVLDKIEVFPHWDGFRVKYPEISGRSEGYINIYYIGVNPKTNEIDSLLVSSMPISKDGRNVQYTQLDDKSIEDVTVIVKTEDARGNVVKKKVYDNVEVAHSEQFDPQILLQGFEGSSVEDDSRKYGYKYLFDGDRKGEQCLTKGNSSKLYSYKSELGAEFNDNVITLDLQNEEEIAWVRIYSHLSALMPNNAMGGMQLTKMKLEFQWYYPNHVTLYATNDKDAPESEWSELSEFKEYAQLDRENRWTYPAFDAEEFYTINEFDLFQKAKPNYIQLNCNISGIGYRYLKIKINETFYLDSGSYQSGNTGEFGMEELEVFVKSE